MNIQTKHHTFYYIALITILFSGLILATKTSYDRELQMLVVITTTAFYILWGILHHAHHHNLTAKIVIEYVLMGTLGITVLFFLLQSTA